MMNNRYRRVVIEDTVAYEIGDTEQANLLDLFEYALKSVTTTLVREARFDMSDFGTAKDRNCEGFNLILERVCVGEREIWRGTFRRANQQLFVTASLE